MEGIGGNGIVQMPGDENQIGLGVVLLQPLAQLDAVHAPQLNIQKGHVAGVLLRPYQSGGGVGKVHHPGLGHYGLNILAQQVQGVWLIIYGQYVHGMFPPLCEW